MTLSNIDRFVTPGPNAELADNIIGSAIRAAGMLCAFPALTDNFQFLNDLADAIIKSDPGKREFTKLSFKLRNNTAWANANLTVVILEKLEKEPQNLKSYMKKTQVFENLIKLAAVSSRDKVDKVVQHGVRATGNLVYIYWKLFLDVPDSKNSFSPKFLESAYKVLQETLEDDDYSKLSKSKIKWNSACAMSIIFQSEIFKKKRPDVVKRFVKTAVRAFVSSHIFKVKNKCTECIMAVEDFKKDELLNLLKFVLVVYSRDVIHVHQTSSDPERQVGIKRVIMRLFLYLVNKLDNLGSLDTKTIGNILNTTENYDKLPLHGAIGINRQKVVIFGEEYTSYETLKSCATHMYESLEALESEVLPVDFDPSDTDVSSKVWFQKEVLKSSELIKSSKPVFL